MQKKKKSNDMISGKLLHNLRDYIPCQPISSFNSHKVVWPKYPIKEEHGKVKFSFARGSRKEPASAPVHKHVLNM